MRTHRSLVGTRFGPVSAIWPRPRGRRDNTVSPGTPTRRRGSQRLPWTLRAGNPRRMRDRDLLRPSDRVPVVFGGGVRLASLVLRRLRHVGDRPRSPEESRPYALGGAWGPCRSISAGV